MPRCPKCGKLRVEMDSVIEVESDTAKAIIHDLLLLDVRKPGLMVDDVVKTILECRVSRLKVREIPGSVSHVVTYHLMLEELASFKRGMDELQARLGKRRGLQT